MKEMLRLEKWDFFFCASVYGYRESISASASGSAGAQYLGISQVLTEGDNRGDTAGFFAFLNRHGVEAS